MKGSRAAPFLALAGQLKIWQVLSLGPRARGKDNIGGWRNPGLGSSQRVHLDPVVLYPAPSAVLDVYLAKFEPRHFAGGGGASWSKQCKIDSK